MKEYCPLIPNIDARCRWVCYSIYHPYFGN